VGTVVQVIERYLGYAVEVGDYQRQLFLVDHAGLPESAVLEQIEILGTEVVPVLRREFEARRPANIPSDPPRGGLAAVEPATKHNHAATDK
ncbi:MAG: 5,10-methylene tetrahydromethanopterin reductase, partial [Corynebacterium variabile]